MSSHATIAVLMILFWIGWALLMAGLIHALRVIDHLFDTENENGDRDS